MCCGVYKESSSTNIDPEEWCYHQQPCGAREQLFGRQQVEQELRAALRAKAMLAGPCAIATLPLSISGCAGAAAETSRVWSVQHASGTCGLLL